MIFSLIFAVRGSVSLARDLYYAKILPNGTTRQAGEEPQTTPTTTASLESKPQPVKTDKQLNDVLYQ